MKADSRSHNTKVRIFVLSLQVKWKAMRITAISVLLFIAFNVSAHTDTLRVVVVRPNLLLYRMVHKDSLFTRSKIEHLEFRNTIQKILEKKNTILSVGVDYEADPRVTLMMFEEIKALKIKNFLSDNVSESEKETIYRQFSIEQLIKEQETQPIALKQSSLNILVFSYPKLIWYDDKEFPIIHVEDFSPNLLGDLANRYRTQPIFLKFDLKANSNLTKLIINELNRLEIMNYEFKELDEKEKKIVSSMLGK
jgi:hypothetical protein